MRNDVDLSPIPLYYGIPMALNILIERRATFLYFLVPIGDYGSLKKLHRISDISQLSCQDTCLFLTGNS